MEAAAALAVRYLICDVSGDEWTHVQAKFECKDNPDPDPCDLSSSKPFQWCHAASAAPASSAIAASAAPASSATAASATGAPAASSSASICFCNGITYPTGPNFDASKTFDSDKFPQFELQVTSSVLRALSSVLLAVLALVRAFYLSVLQA